MVTKSRSADTVNMTGLELISIAKSYGGEKVVRDLSLAFTKGEMFCLLGPSGCGKTTVLKIISGLLEHDKGKVFLEGRDITGQPPQKRSVSLVFQNYALFPHMNVFENVAYGLRRRGFPEDNLKRQVKETLAFVRLDDYGKRRVHELSGGEQQRIALARALVIRPQALLLDEPLSNLDARLRTDIRREIRRIQRELELTTIYVTHDQEEAMSLADRIGVMNKGKVEQTGTPREIYENPATRFVADFIGQSNFIEGEIKNGSLIIMGREFSIPEGSLPHWTKGTCAVRPERIRLDAARESSFKGTIQESTYLGPVVRYQLALEVEGNTRELIAELPVSQAVFQPGDSVSIEFQPEDIRFFAR